MKGILKALSKGPWKTRAQEGVGVEIAILSADGKVIAFLTDEEAASDEACINAEAMAAVPEMLAFIRGIATQPMDEAKAVAILKTLRHNAGAILRRIEDAY